MKLISWDGVLFTAYLVEHYFVVVRPTLGLEGGSEYLYGNVLTYGHQVSTVYYIKLQWLIECFGAVGVRKGY